MTTLNQLHNMAQAFSDTEPMPVLFVGHGNPMYAITDNEYAKYWQQLGKTLPRPNAILCISAHWETQGTYVTAAEKPVTIHDFYGFPQPLFEVQYPAPGSPALAELAKETAEPTSITFSNDWGFDHGCWAVIKHLYPAADVPVVELSLDTRKTPAEHYKLGKELAALRRKGILIIGSGNMVHNLRMVSWHTPGGFDWAIEANEKFKKLISSNDHAQLINYASLGREVQLAIPTAEHYLPLLYTLGLKQESDNISFFNDKTEMGSLSMTSVKFG